MLVCESVDPSRFGVLETDSDGFITGIEEKPENPKTNIVSTGAMLLDNNIFKFPAKQHQNGEFYLTDSIEQMIASGHKVKAIRSSFWFPIGYPEDLAKAEEVLRK